MCRENGSGEKGKAHHAARMEGEEASMGKRRKEFSLAWLCRLLGALFA
jgi:hypothetical protein